MRRTILMGLAGAALVLVGLVIGLLVGGRIPAFAASGARHNAAANGTGATKYCQIYEQTLANDLNVDPRALERANVDALGKTLDQMVNDKEITATEATHLRSLLAQAGTQPCAHLNAKSLMTYLQSDSLVLPQYLMARKSLMNAVATALGVSPSTLQSDLAGGQTVAAIAAARKVPADTVSAAYLAAVKEFLAQDVSSAVITKEQSEYAYNLIAQMVNSGHYPLLDATDKK